MRENIQRLVDALDELHVAILEHATTGREAGSQPHWVQPVDTLIGDIQYLLDESAELTPLDLNDVCEEVAQMFRDESPTSFAEGYRNLVSNSDELNHRDARWRSTFKALRAIARP